MNGTTLKMTTITVAATELQRVAGPSAIVLETDSGILVYADRASVQNAPEPPRKQVIGSRLLNDLGDRISLELFNGDTLHGFNVMCKVISNDLGINLNQRSKNWAASHGGAKPEKVELLKPEELGPAVSAVVKYCELKHVDISDLIEQWGVNR